MELSYWIYFKPGEKDKLKQIIDENPNPLMANIAIQEEFVYHSPKLRKLLRCITIKLIKHVIKNHNT